MNTTISTKKSFNKKFFLIAVISALFLILIGIILAFLFINNNEKVKVLNYKKNYVIQSQDENLTFSCFVNKKKQSFLRQTMIKGLYLTGLNSEEIKIKLKNIEKKEEKFHYQGNDYYQYDLTINIPLTCDETLFIENACVKILTINKKVELPIGTVTIIGNSNDNSPKMLNVVKAKGIVNSIGKMESLVAVYFKLRSITSELEIKDIVALSPCVEVSRGLIKEMPEIDHTTNLKDIFPNYDYYNLYNGDDKIICDNDERGYLIPLKYNYQTHLSQLAFKIVYTYNGKTLTEIIPAYKYFTSSANYDLVNMQEV